MKLIVIGVKCNLPNSHVINIVFIYMSFSFNASILTPRLILVVLIHGLTLWF